MRNGGYVKDVSSQSSRVLFLTQGGGLSVSRVEFRVV